MNYNIAVIPGDGIGPEIVKEAIHCLNIVGEKYGHEFNYKYLLAGGCAIDDCGNPLRFLRICQASRSKQRHADGGGGKDGNETAHESTSRGDDDHGR